MNAGHTVKLIVDWTSVSDLSGSERYSVGLSKIKYADPGPNPDTFYNGISYEDVQPGSWYVNVKPLVNNPASYIYAFEVLVPTWTQPTMPALVPTSYTYTSPTMGPESDLVVGWNIYEIAAFASMSAFAGIGLFLILRSGMKQ